jgi:hypothetical protein
VKPIARRAYSECGGLRDAWDKARRIAHRSFEEATCYWERSLFIILDINGNFRFSLIPK